MTEEPAAGAAGTLVQELADFVCELRLQQIPDAVQAEARRCILDTLGVIAAGRKAEVAEAARQWAVRTYDSGSAGIAADRTGLQAAGTAFVNACAGHAWDFDDTSYTGIMHGSVAVLPAALALAQQQSCGGAQLLEAFIAGVEVEYAVAEYCTTHLYFKGWWSSGVYGALGAAAAASRLLGLDRAAVSNALSLALCHACGIKAAFGSDAKPLGMGIAASRGVDCALWAQAGLTGPVDVFENERGFLSLYNDNQQSTHSGLQLWSRWRLLEPGILFKRYPVCSAAQAATELCEILLHRHGLSADSVLRVECEVPELVRISLVYDHPATVREAQFSLPFAIGCILGFGELGLKQLTMETLRDDRLQAQMQKVSMRVPESLQQDPSVPERCPEGAGLRLVTAAGIRAEDFLERPTGMPGNPVSDEALNDKCLACLTYGDFTDAQAAELCEQLWRLDAIEDVSKLKLFAGG